MSNWYERRLAALKPPHPLDWNPWAVPAYGHFLADVFAEFWWTGRQLTTGAERVPDVCRCRTQLVESGSQYGVARVRDPRCVIHRPEYLELRTRPVRTYGDPPACSCRYGLHPTIWGFTHTIDVHGVGKRGAAYTFRIDPRCMHHGDDVRVITSTRLRSVTVDGRPAWETLDDAERRGE